MTLTFDFEGQGPIGLPLFILWVPRSIPRLECSSVLHHTPKIKTSPKFYKNQPSVTVKIKHGYYYMLHIHVEFRFASKCQILVIEPDSLYCGKRENTPEIP